MTEAMKRTRDGRRSRPRAVAIGLAAAALLAPATAFAGRPRELPARTVELVVDHDGLTRPYLLHVPEGIAATRRVPLLIQLHGGGGTTDGMERLTGFSAIAAREGFVVASPEGVGGYWNDGRNPDSVADDVGFLDRLVEVLVTTLPIDPDRVHVVGISNGAMMAGRLACELPERFAAIAQVAGAYGAEALASCAPGRPMPVLQIHGSADPIVPYGGGVVFGGRGDAASVDSWAAFWVAQNAAAGPETVALADDVSLRAWSGTSPRSVIAFLRVEEGGHTWPGSAANLPPILVGRTSPFPASEVIWSFLSAQARD
jgi:polyhydroxybutyrate depolymerase